MKRAIFSNKADNCKYIFARITGMPLFSRGQGKQATAVCWHLYAVLLIHVIGLKFASSTTCKCPVSFFSRKKSIFVYIW